MNKNFKQQFVIKQVPTDDAPLLQQTLNSTCDEGWELYSIYETEQNSKIVYNCIFIKEVEIEEADDDNDIAEFRNKVERMLYTKEEPYELCINLQKKIRDKKEKIEQVKKFLENSKDEERELLNDEVKKNIDELNVMKKDLKEILSPSKMSKMLGVEKLSISLSSENYCLCDNSNPDNLLSQTVKVRQDLTRELGYIIPKVQFIENSTLDEFEFTINVHGVAIARAHAYPNYVAFFEDELNMEKLPKNSIKEKDPLTKRKLVWIKEEDCQNYWIDGFSPTQYIASYLNYYTVSHVDEIFDYIDLNKYIDFVSNQNSFLVDSIVGDYISISELKYLLVQLIRERVSIKDITYIFEKLNDFSDDPNKADLLEKLRMALSRQISDSISNKDKEIFAYEIDDDTFELLERQTNAEESSVKIDLSKFSKFKKILKETRNEILNQNAVIVVPQNYRQVVFILVSQLFMDIPVICYEEIGLDYKLNILGKI